MTVADVIPDGVWEVVGTDVSSRVVRLAQRGVYPIAASEKIPTRLLRKYCRKGRDEYEGLMAISPELRARVVFLRANLLDDLRSLGKFDVILLRNVMIYFEAETRADLVGRIQNMLTPGGYLMVSHSETLAGVPSRLGLVRPSIYQLVGNQ
jgi:chemotaxis protein methyltransferase CheR